jgi:hypothetical protein
VNHDPLQPGEPLAGRLAGKPVEAAVGLEERLLDDIGGVDLRAQAALEVVAGGEIDVAATGIEEPLAGCVISAPRRREPAGDPRAAAIGRG